MLADLEFNKGVNVLPQFKGGQKAMEKFICKQMVYPKLALQLQVEGRVIVSTHVDKKGILSKFAISESDDSIFNAEALRIVRLMPQWIPAIQKGRSVDSEIKIPIFFRLKPIL